MGTANIARRIQKEEQQQVNEALQHALFAEAAPSVCLSLFVAVATLLFFGERVDFGILLYWTLAAAVISSLRLLLVVIARHRGDRPLPVRAFAIVMVLTGMFWGSATLMWSPSLQPTDQLLIALLPIFAALGIIVPLGCSPLSYRSFIAGLLVTMIFTMSMHAEYGLMRLVIPLVLIVLCCLFLSHRIHQQMREMLLLRLRNQRALQSKDDFLARISHELRTPMNGVLGMVRMLDKTALSPEQQQIVATLSKSGEDMLRLVVDLLDAASLSSNDVMLSVEACDMRRLSKELVESYRRKLSGSNVTLTLEFDAQVPALLVIDAQRWRQLCQKLLDNAVKFTDRGTINLQLSIRDDKLQMLVRDTGCGIAERDLESVGMLFQTAIGETRSFDSGCGVGLTIAQGLVDLMDGSLQIESELGKGTLVRVEVPLIPVDGPIDLLSESPMMNVFAAFDPSRGSVPSSEPVRVLVAEDSPINQLVIESLLKEQGCEVTLVQNGLEALLALQARSYDIVFMDCQMPELDGYEATRQARENGYSLPIVAVTANVVAGSRERCMEAGMNDYVCKPLAADSMQLMLEKWVGQNRSDLPLAEAA